MHIGFCTREVHTSICDPPLQWANGIQLLFLDKIHHLLFKSCFMVDIHRTMTSEDLFLVKCSLSIMRSLHRFCMFSQRKTNIPKFMRESFKCWRPNWHDTTKIEHISRSINNNNAGMYCTALASSWMFQHPWRSSRKGSFRTFSRLVGHETLMVHVVPGTVIIIYWCIHNILDQVENVSVIIPRNIRWRI